MTGSFLDSPEFGLLRHSAAPRYWELQDNIYDSPDLVARHQLYRGTVQWRSPVGDLRLGGQQVNWSTALIWNPMDILNPVTPTGLMVGEFAEVTKAGFSGSGSGSGSVAGTGWRTEFVWSNPDAGNYYWQGVVDLNRALPGGFNLAAEYFYNSHPEPQAGFDLARLLSTQPVYSARHYAGLLVWQDISAFWQYRVVGIRNADDGSWVLYPRSTWTLPLEPEIYLTAGAQWFGGDNDSEYGRFEPLGLMEVQWFF